MQNGNCTITLDRTLPSGYHSQHWPGHHGCRRARRLSFSIQVLSNLSPHKTKDCESEVYPNTDLNYGIHVEWCQSEFWLRLNKARNITWNWVMTRLFKWLTTRLRNQVFPGILGEKKSIERKRILWNRSPKWDNDVEFSPLYFRPVPNSAKSDS